MSAMCIPQKSKFGTSWEERLQSSFSCFTSFPECYQATVYIQCKVFPRQSPCVCLPWLPWSHAGSDSCLDCCCAPEYSRLGHFKHQDIFKLFCNWRRPLWLQCQCFAIITHSCIVLHAAWLTKESMSLLPVYNYYIQDCCNTSFHYIAMILVYYVYC